MKNSGWTILLFTLMFTQSVFAVPKSVIVPAGKLTPFWLKPQKGNRKIVYKVGELEVYSTQVTNADFIEFIKKNPQWSKSDVPAIYAEATYLEQLEGDQQSNSAPVTAVSWYAARAYCESTGFRLPTINEWEYLAAASEKVRDANRNAAFLKRILDWYVQPKEQGLLPAKSIYKSRYGLYDMHGLVWEWVEDFNSSLVSGESREDSSFNKNLFCGAGGMNSGDKENYAAFMRFAFRSSLKGNVAIWNLGFRCVKDADKKDGVRL